MMGRVIRKTEAGGHAVAACGRTNNGLSCSGHEAGGEVCRRAGEVMAVIAAGPGLGGHNPSYEACGGRAAT